MQQMNPNHAVTQQFWISSLQQKLNVSDWIEQSKNLI
ncbi:unnamed protein product [Paramecium octaurelia]|uniref:Uncharacterized protein n=1 Tax=Paramecium octaurelia TaxID=43137 RepID=A0A8S1S2D4_PAROT|nr:unnamed protein product [Paramecium octaurelia]